MPAPKVTIKEIDLSTRVPEFPGVYGGIVIPATKGPVLTPTLITNEAQLLKTFTPNERVEVGYDLAYYSALAFLQASNKLWVVRPDTSALYGGTTIYSTAVSGTNAAWGAGQDEPTSYSFGASEAFILTGANPGVWNNDISIKLYTYKTAETVTVDAEADKLTVTQVWETGYPVTVSSTAIMPAPLVAGTTYYTIQDVAGKTKLATSAENAATGTAIDLTTAGSGTITLKPYKDFVKEAGTMLLEVYRTAGATTTLEETWTISKTLGKKDGYGQNIYLEDVLLGSNFVRGVDNPLVSDTTVILGQLIRLNLAGGDDGSQILESMMIAAADQFLNESAVMLTLLMDGGYASSGYGTKLVTVAETRQDCVAILSTPYDKESSAAYATDIVDYRKTILNLNSSYGALYSPHCKIYDKFNNRALYVAPDGYAAAAISKTASNQEIWYPVAGFTRGPILVNDLRRRFTSGEMDLLYDNGINPLRFAPGRGILIWGQKTLLARPSALDRLNVRLMLIVIEPAIKEALEDFLYEINDGPTRNRALIVLDAYMKGIQARRGVYAYRIVCDTTNNLPIDIDNHKMNVGVYVTPTSSIEEIPCSVVITNNSVSFAVAQTLVG